MKKERRYGEARQKNGAWQHWQQVGGHKLKNAKSEGEICIRFLKLADMIHCFKNININMLKKALKGDVANTSLKSEFYTKAGNTCQHLATRMLPGECDRSMKAGGKEDKR